MLDFGSCFRHDARMILELHSPLDMHLHLRDGDMLKLVAPLSSASFAGAVVMPNLVPPVADAEEVQAYRGRIMDACGGDVFKPYMTAFSALTRKGSWSGSRTWFSGSSFIRRGLPRIAKAV